MATQTTKQAWAAEPWTTHRTVREFDGREGRALSIRDANNLIVAILNDGYFTDEAKGQVPNAERIVACVNALAGIADPDAFMQAVEALLAEAGKAAHTLTKGRDYMNQVGVIVNPFPPAEYRLRQEIAAVRAAKGEVAP